MEPILLELPSEHTPESLSRRLLAEPGLILLRTGGSRSPRGCSFVAARPFLTLRVSGARCELRSAEAVQVQFGNPWRVIESLLARYEILVSPELCWPFGGCFGFWGYDLKNHVEPGLPRPTRRDLDLPDAWLGFYGSLVIFDHEQSKTWVVSTGLTPEGERDRRRARAELEFWREHLEADGPRGIFSCPPESAWEPDLQSSLSDLEFMERVRLAQSFIQRGDIYQLNLAQRYAADWPFGAWPLFETLGQVSPAPFSAYLDASEFALVSSSPELFMRMQGSSVLTRPIKGTRPRSDDPKHDAELRRELEGSEKERAELVMITDLLRNDLGRICRFGSVHVPQLAAWEPFAQVQHLFSSISGELKPEMSHAAALSSCFPGGSITGAPKIRAMELIDELEPVSRGPYTGALGYLGFNRSSQLSILIRTALCFQGQAYFHAGAGIVADSVPEAEYAETVAKAGGFLEALRRGAHLAHLVPNAASDASFGGGRSEQAFSGRV